jgi:hypothetical protein
MSKGQFTFHPLSHEIHRKYIYNVSSCPTDITDRLFTNNNQLMFYRTIMRFLLRESYGMKTHCVGTIQINVMLKQMSLTSPTGGGRSVGIVRSRTKATEFYLFLKADVT